MKKNRIITLIALVVLTAFGTLSCNKEKMELRRTVYFYTEHNPLDVLTLNVEDKLIGEINYVEGGITSFTDKDKGLKHTFDKKENHVVVKNSAGQIVVDLVVEVSKYRTQVAFNEVIKGSIATSSFDDGDAIGTIIGVNP